MLHARPLLCLLCVIAHVQTAAISPGECAFEQVTGRTINVSDVPLQYVLLTATNNPSVQQCFQDCCDFPEGACTTIVHRDSLGIGNGSSDCYLLSCLTFQTCALQSQEVNSTDESSIVTILQVQQNVQVNTSDVDIPLADVENFMDTFVLVFAGTMALIIGAIMLCLCAFLAYSFHKENQRIMERKMLTPDCKAPSFSYME